MPARPRVFLDSSALFAAAMSGAGGARMVLKLGETGAIQLLVCVQVLDEVESALRRKAPAVLGYLTILVDRSAAEVVPEAAPEVMARCRDLIPHPGDARILAAAWSAQVDLLVTLDRVHFLNVPHLKSAVPFSPATPADLLSWCRDRLQGLLVD
jgi:predicted nucleic acid-binding protein